MNSEQWSKLAARAVLLIVAVAAPFTGAWAQGQGQQAPGTLVTAGDRVIWAVPFANGGAELRVTGPDGIHFKQRFDTGQRPSLDIISNEYGPLPDGQYSYELRPFRKVPPANDARPSFAGTDHFSERGSDVHSGAFTIKDGRVVDNSLTEPVSGKGSGKAVSDGALKDQVILDDLIVDGSLCVGFDCVNGEVFNFDTIRLKENNLRIKFQDTSTSASFPTRDWELTANDSANGGASRFSIRDVDGGRDVFTVEADAPSNSLYVDSGGRVGLGTSNPVVENHIVDGDTPTIRLEQDGSSGFQPQIWDVAGNETNFFVRDTTSGSTLPFRIQPGADSNAIFIRSNNNVGMGTSSPERQLHVTGTSDNTRVKVENTNGTVNGRTLFELNNNGGITFAMVDTSAGGDDWNFLAETGTGTPGFSITRSGSGVRELRLAPNGDLNIAGTLSQGSSRSIKDAITPVSAEAVLSKLEALEIAEWSYDGKLKERHLGPMAEDFYSVFGLGPDTKHISPGDMAGVALVAAKALKSENEKLKEDSDRKAEHIEALEARIERLEALVLESR